MESRTFLLTTLVLIALVFASLGTVRMKEASVPPVAYALKNSVGPALLSRPPDRGFAAAPSDTTTWERFAIPVAPPGRYSSAMAYDPADGYSVLFGGFNNSNQMIYGDTWVFRAGQWTQLSPSPSPNPSDAMTMTWDAADGYILLYDGEFNSTWSFLGGKWTNLSLAVTPPSRTGDTLAYDLADGYAVMFGGDSVRPVIEPLNDTWMFKGGQWIQLSLAVSPSPRSEAATDYDAADGYVLLFGGFNYHTGTLGDTWSFKSGQWTALTPSVGPPSESGGSIAFSASLGYVVLFGGIAIQPLDTTWAFRGGTWTLLTPTGAPAARSLAAMDYDSSRGYALLFSGVGMTTPFGDTWAFNVSLSATSSASPMDAYLGQTISFSCAALGGVPAYAFSWSLGDGSSATEPTVQHAYSIAGTTTATCTATDTASATVASSVSVHINGTLVVFLASNRSSVDVGQPVAFLAQSFGGNGTVKFAWISLPQGCSGSNSSEVACSPTAPGQTTVRVTVTDANGSTASRSLPFAVFELPMVSLVVNRTSADVGQPVTFTATASGGSGGLAYAWSGLPTGCAPSNVSTLACTPSGAGTSTVTVTVNDSNGGSGGRSLTFTVYLDLMVVLAASPTSLLQGAGLTVNATVQGGSGGDTYSWSGLPPGCTAQTDSPKVMCVPTAAGSFDVVVTATDSNGMSTAASVSVDVAPSFLGMPALEGYALVSAIAAVLVIAALIVLARHRRKGPSAGLDANQPPPPSE